MPLLEQRSSVITPVIEREEGGATSEPLSEAINAIDLNKSKEIGSPSLPSPAVTTSSPASPPQADPDAMDTDPLGSGTATPIQAAHRPQAPIPTRSTLAQSSFSWMLEPDESSSSSSLQAAAASAPRGKGAPNSLHRKRPSANANRERTAFLFGEVPSDENGQPALPEDMFGLELMGKSKS
ncbi:putative tbc domain-containing protein [Eutypa lata UCREL1]|uniref:Putative tbc domain-containing protein n=1 Tax=Eutypa lata (strain UCR-EL1) TaxID=1287681 RepID=M7TFB8_EUTLA|nr:putative tbc domain-containing protein [Eutypa lata UCREL1]